MEIDRKTKRYPRHTLGRQQGKKHKQEIKGRSTSEQRCDQIRLNSISNGHSLGTG